MNAQHYKNADIKSVKHDVVTRSIKVTFEIYYSKENLEMAQELGRMVGPDASSVNIDVLPIQLPLMRMD